MKKIIIGIITIFLLTSCYSNPEDTKKITELEKQIQENDLLKKKKECFFYKDKIKKSIEKRMWGTPYNISIFYSKKSNSCIATYYISYGKLGVSVFIEDYLSSERLYFGSCKNMDIKLKCKNVYNNYIKKIEELKKIKLE